jgi:hypothetical protein
MQKQIHDWKLAKYCCYLHLEAFDSWKYFTNRKRGPNWRRNIEFNFHTGKHHGWKQNRISLI